MNTHKLLTLLIATVISTPVMATKMAEFSSNNSQTNAPQVNSTKDTLHVISNIHTNRIVTPFNSPSIKLDNVEGVSYKKRGHVLYLSTKSNANVAAFITEGGDESTAIKVVLTPKRVAPQEIILESDHVQGSSIAKRFEQSSPRTETIVNILSSIAVGNPPAGYQQKEVNASYLPQCYQDGLTFEFYNGQFFSGGDYVVSIGVAINNTNQLISLKENQCYQDGVVGVAAYPSHDINPNSKTEILVMYHREKAPVRKANKRQSLLLRGQ